MGHLGHEPPLNGPVPFRRLQREVTEVNSTRDLILAIDAGVRDVRGCPRRGFGRTGAATQASRFARRPVLRLDGCLMDEVTRPRKGAASWVRVAIRPLFKEDHLCLAAPGDLRFCIKQAKSRSECNVVRNQHEVVRDISTAALMPATFCAKGGRKT